MKKISVLVFSIALLLLSSDSIFGKRILPQAKPSGNTQAVGSAKKVTISVKFRSDRKAIIISFNNLTAATKVDYSLNYNTHETMQGAGGSISSTAGNSVTRELLFGTCSHGVCRYDTGITNAKLIVTTKLNNGTKVIKTYILRI